MPVILATIAAWLLKNAVQRILLGAGLSIVGYLGTMAAVRAAFNAQLDSLNGLAPNLLALMGLAGVDRVISAFVSVSIFLLTLNAGKLFLRKA
ncbi:DUF2523 family protein [Acinetobacter ursingii]|uniref:DUF2523 family protein n=1 Tax=Acinetobacter ursingii TaxID=108980 RepID=UPI00124C8F33|nr:DUF2523 family protein [Acinetobacter ursingii]